MKRIIYILLMLAAALQAYHSKAQSCPANPTYTNKNGAVDLTSGTSVVYNDAKSYQLNVQNNFAATASICVTNGATLSLQFQNVNNISKGGSIYVDAKSKLILTGNSLNNFPLTITNAGTVTQSTSMGWGDGATLVNSGTYDMNVSSIINSGTVSITNSGTFNANASLGYNNGTFSITNSGNFTFSSSLTLGSTKISNSGNMVIKNAATLQASSYINNSGYLTIASALSFSSANIDNYGVIYATGSTIINSGCTLNNYCTFKESADFSNNGTVNNTGSLLLNVNGLSTFLNQGVITTGTSSFIQGTTFSNNNTIKGGGNFYFSGVTTNQGSFTGGDKGINFYDATPSLLGTVFDLQTGATINTTKNKISANTATSFTTCSDVTAPAITTQPATQYFCTAATTSATFSVAATSVNTPTYQWYKNGTAITGATSSSYTATGLTINDTAAAFSVAVTNAVGSTRSSSAYVKYIITGQPVNASVNIGKAFSFAVSASYATAYQWQKTGINITGATAASYGKSASALTDAGSYAAIVTYAGGTCTSNTATLVVENTPVITSQPATQYFCTATTTSATFSVAATSNSLLSYQWYKNGTAITGAILSSYTATGLTINDTSSAFSVIATNAAGSTTSSSAYVKYIITGQPVSASVNVGAAFNFSVKASYATAYQWQKTGISVTGATAASYGKSAAALTDAGSYAALVTYAGGTCTSNAATLVVENIPVISAQPVTQTICTPATTVATFSVAATSNSAISYQWYKNNTSVTGATASAYTATGLTLADTLNSYKVVVTNIAGSVTSNAVSIKYVIVSQPSPASQYLATGNSASFSLKVSNAISMQWQKNGSFITGATSSSYSIPTVNYADSGKYTILVSYNGGTCTSDAAALKTSIVLYSKSTGKLNLPGTWGVSLDGSGSSPVDFTRSEHTFIIANRQEAETGADLTIAGTLDVANVKMTITPNTTLQANKVTRSLSVGSILASSTTSLVVGYGSTSADQSDLYFDAKSNTLKNLTINAKTVVLRSALNITSGKNFGVLQVNYGTFNTSDLLTLKSDSLGTAGIAKSAGTITGKVTIEKWTHARRAWRLIGAPITSTDAPTINAAWQEGATTSSANPVPGFGTHITGGTEANGFDISPTNNASLKYLNASNKWTGLSNTNKTSITQYPAYMLFVRGDRSYNISTTTNKVAPMTTILRIKGNVNQGTLAAQTVAATGYTTVTNPYASPINFARVISTSTNIKKRIRVWDPTLAGQYGVGAWVVVDGTTGTYRSTPPSTYVTSVLQAGQGFILESADGKTAGSLNLNEDDKDFTVNTISSDRVVGSTTDTSLEVNLKMFNDDSSASLADGILYNFGSSNIDSADANDAVKMNNAGENIAAKDGSQYFTIDSRTAPKEGDSLELSLYNTKAASYQFEFVPSLLKNKTFALYDKYLNTLTAISSSDTTHITFSILSSVAASSATDRFIIVAQKSKVALPTPVAKALTFIKVKAEAKNKAISVEWNVQNESAVLYYTVEKSTDGVHFADAGNVVAASKGAYSFTDATPASGINYYRIKGVSNTGSLYAPVVSGSLNATASASVSVYPNPLTGTTFTATLGNLSQGTYTLSVVNSNGTTVAVKTLAHSGGTASQKVTLNSQLAAGVYYIKISADGATVGTTTLTAL